MLPDSNGINFISSQGKNGGIVGRVKEQVGIKVYPPGIITVPLKGTVLQAYLQLSPCYVAHQIAVLEPIDPMTDGEKLFYCMCIKHNRFRYNYGRQADLSLHTLLLPAREEIPAWVNNDFSIDLEKYAHPFTIDNTLELKVNDWRRFTVEELFDSIESGKSVSACELPEGDEIWYIGAMKRDNGAIKKVKKIPELVTKGNCIILIQNGQGSAGYANYIEADFIGTKDVSVGYSTHLNKYNGLFLACVFGIEKYRYSFGRKWNGNRLRMSSIRLPAKKNADGVVITDDDGNYIPDWNFMEKYVKSLPYSSNI